MDRRAEGFEPGFRDIIFGHHGLDKGNRLIQAFARMEVFSLDKLNTIAACDDVSIPKQTSNAKLARASMVKRVPPPLAEVINSAVKMWVLFRTRGAPKTPRGSSRKRVRAYAPRARVG